MKKMSLFALLSFALLGPVFPASASEVYVVHGIPGQDLGLDPALPVDVCLAGGTAVLTDVTFPAIAGPLALDPGRYELEVRLDADAPCGGALATLATLDLSVAESATMVAHLTEEGTPALTKFVNDLRPAAEGNARVVARHGAAVGPVSITFRRGRLAPVIPFLDNSDQYAAELKAGQWDVRIFPFLTARPAFGPAALTFGAKTVTFLYAVGSKTGSFTVLPQTLPLP